MERLIYQSTGTGSTGSLLNMATILAESQRNNDRDGLTGALAAHNGRFIQVLEGKRPDIDRLLSRLVHDPRHRDIVLIERSQISTRLFGSWSMANARFDPRQAARLDNLMSQDLPGPTILGMMLEAMDQAA